MTQAVEQARRSGFVKEGGRPVTRLGAEGGKELVQTKGYSGHPPAAKNATISELKALKGLRTGRDPGSIARSDPQGFQQAVSRRAGRGLLADFENAVNARDSETANQLLGPIARALRDPGHPISRAGFILDTFIKRAAALSGTETLDFSFLDFAQ
jgi:hypothetical protein